MAKFIVLYNEFNKYYKKVKNLSLSEREMTISCDESMVTDMDMQLEVDVDLKVPNYQEGDKIFAFFLPGNKTGTISRVCDIVSKSGHPIYEVIDEDGEVHEICETLFDSEEDLNFMEYCQQKMMLLRIYLHHKRKLI